MEPDPASPHQPAILSALYGYDGCIGGVNSHTSQEEYLDELVSRNCTVVTKPDGSRWEFVI